MRPKTYAGLKTLARRRGCGGAGAATRVRRRAWRGPGRGDTPRPSQSAQARGDPTKAKDVNRARDDFEISLIRAAMEKKLPILGICRGCQLLNVVQGGTLQNLRDDEELKELHFNVSGHAADLMAGGRLADIMETDRLAKVQSYHLQAVQKVGQGLRVSAMGPGGVIEAIEGTGEGWIVAVQWHPELSVGDPRQNALLVAFVKEAKKK